MKNKFFAKIAKKRHASFAKKTKFLPAQVDNSAVDSLGKKLTDEAAKHLAENKVVCGECHADWCKSCRKLTGYHQGYTCD